jgi:tetratricopeptide (TPR) repeat protein
MNSPAMNSAANTAAAVATPAGDWAEIERVERDLQAATAARPADPARLAAAVEGAVAAVRRWPQAAEVFVVAELLGELSEVYEQLGRIGEALTVMQEAIEAGYRSQPDPRCRIAEIHLRAGNQEPAHEIFARVKADTPDDVWLYNNAGLEYGHAGDHERALVWLTEGLELALHTGDPQRLVAQLSDLRREQLAALGREHDELEARADVFLADPRPRPPRGRAPAQLPAALAAHDRVGGRKPAAVAAVPAPPSAGRAGGRVRMAFGWFPPGEFAAALAAWPQLASEWGTSDHVEYCRALQRHLCAFAETDQAAAVAGPAWIVSIRVEAFRAWCAHTGRDPATGLSRAGYAAEQARTAVTGTQTEDMIAWPPARNDRCWCRSGRKYKQCCGHPSITGPRK